MRAGVGRAVAVFSVGSVGLSARDRQGPEDKTQDRDREMAHCARYDHHTLNPSRVLCHPASYGERSTPVSTPMGDAGRHEFLAFAAASAFDVRRKDRLT